jgi:hypothetical protein
MITVVHGNDTAASRKFYIENRDKSSSYILIEKVNFDTLYQLIEGNSLFGESKDIFLENFFTNVKSNTTEFKKITEYLSSNKAHNIFLWEGKELTKTQQFTFKNAKVLTFSYPSNLFEFLDSITPNNRKSLLMFKELEKVMETELIFYMIVRQFRLLISIHDSSGSISETKSLAPWLRSKLKRQADLFGKEKLLRTYKRLYEIDYQTKFGLTPLNLSTSIDIFLVSL